MYVGSLRVESVYTYTTYMCVGGGVCNCVRSN